MSKKLAGPMSGKTWVAQDAIKNWLFRQEYKCEYFDSMTEKEWKNRRFLDEMAYDYVFHTERCDRDNGIWVENYQEWVPKPDKRAFCTKWAKQMYDDLINSVRGMNFSNKDIRRAIERAGIIWHKGEIERVNNLKRKGIFRGENGV